MLVSAIRAHNVQDAIVRLLGAAVAGWLATFMFAFLLSQFAIASFWTSLVGSDGSLAVWAPVAVIGVLSGASVGIALGLYFKGNAFRVATIAALLQLVVHGALVSIPSSAALAIGLVAGAFVADRFRGAQHATTHPVLAKA